MSDATDPRAADAAPRNVDDPLVYAVTLAPHRSLSAGGIKITMVATGLASLMAGALFASLGAWPVAGFFGLDLLLLGLALRASARAARAREHITVTVSLIEVTSQPARGRGWVVRLNPFWTRVQRQDDEDYGTQEVALVSGPRRVPVGSFLCPESKGQLATELSAALGMVRRGVARDG